MIKRYCGELEIGLHYCGRTPDNRAKYLGYLKLPDGRRWRFADLHSRVGADGTRPQDFDSMAQSAVGFATYWTSHNRGHDTPEWAPPADLADAFDSAAELGEKDYLIARKLTAPT
jgi:hypothetical protein